MPKKNRKGSWIVEVRVTTIRELVVEDCTEEQDMEDCDVLDVNPND